jgi:hypothetical protein
MATNYQNGIKKWLIRCFSDLFTISPPIPRMLTEYDANALTTLRSSFEEVGNAVRAAQSLLHRGGSVDLAGMDARIERLCVRALDLPPPLARATLPDLMDLRGRVEELIEALTRRSAR